MPPFEIQKRTFQFSLKVINYFQHLPRSIVADILAKQLIRASSSIGANITEAQGSISRREFLQFMHIARKSNYETLYWLRLFQELNQKDEKILEFINEATELKDLDVDYSLK